MDVQRVGLLQVENDIAAADWIVSGLRHFQHDVASLVPQGFPSYARVFHPAGRMSNDQEHEVRWSDVADANERQAHPAMEWTSITGSWRFLHNDNQPGLWDNTPSQGSLPSQLALRLASRLEPFTETPTRCWFAVWEGFGALAVDAERQVKVELPQRPMVLLSGPLTGVQTSLVDKPFDQRASLWWPDDRSWCVATDVDLMTTYVGGSQDCVDAICADDGIEAMPVSVNQSVTWDSDTINPLPPDAPG